MDWKLSLWSGVDQYEAARSPSRIVRIDQETIIKDGDKEEGNVFTVENYGETRVEFLCPTKENKVMWLSHLYQHACDQKRWKMAAQNKMKVLSPDSGPSMARSFGRTRCKLVLVLLNQRGDDEDNVEDIEARSDGPVVVDKGVGMVAKQVPAKPKFV